MALSKRVRYEVLRRDGNACRYCGAKAPDAVLGVDHVVPVALGGSDDPTNLVAACVDCNAGKTSSTPDAALVAEVQADALRWAAAMKQAADEVRQKAEDRAELYGHIELIWMFPRKLPPGWRTSVDAFLEAGLDPETILEMCRVAKSARGVDNRWGYFCGCCWKRVTQLQERSREILAAQEDGAHGA